MSSSPRVRLAFRILSLECSVLVGYPPELLQHRICYFLWFPSISPMSTIARLSPTINTTQFAVVMMRRRRGAEDATGTTSAAAAAAAVATAAASIKACNIE